MSYVCLGKDGSAAGKVPSPGHTIYSASKHALQGYFHSLRSEIPDAITRNTCNT